MTGEAAACPSETLPADPVDIDPDLIKSSGKLLTAANLPALSDHPAQKTWSESESRILECIYTLIPSKKDSVSQITVWPTNFGTSCSFNTSFTAPYHVYIWLRFDQSVTAIVEAVLTSITRNDVFNRLGGVWQESEIIVDWLLSYSPLNSLLKKIDPHWESSLTVRNTRNKQNGKLVQLSNSFLQKIGAPSVNPAQISSVAFTPREKQIMDLLTSSAPRPVTTDQVGDIIFRNNPDDYSLYAVSKSIQRLRDKLEQNGISGSFIQTKRGEGYLLAS